MKFEFRFLEEAIIRRNSSLDDPGFCIICGEEKDGCEPDARQYKCDVCGEDTVYSPEEILLIGKLLK